MEIDDSQYLTQQANEGLKRLNRAPNYPKLELWPFYQALIQIYYESQTSTPEIKTLKLVTYNTHLPLVFRDLAFRQYVTNWIRYRKEDKPDSVFELIDAFEDTSTSLSGTALLAENILLNEGISMPSRSEEFPSKLKRTFLDLTCLDSNRIIAMNLLAENYILTDSDLTEVYSNASETLQTAILRIIVAAPEKFEKNWLKDYPAHNPEQDLLIYKIFQSHSNH